MTPYLAIAACILLSLSAAGLGWQWYREWQAERRLKYGQQQAERELIEALTSLPGDLMDQIDEIEIQLPPDHQLELRFDRTWHELDHAYRDAA